MIARVLDVHTCAPFSNLGIEDNVKSYNTN
jgi:hypothetical protein